MTVVVINYLSWYKPNVPSYLGLGTLGYGPGTYQE